jgi:hypothetical protein
MVCSKCMVSCIERLVSCPASRDTALCLSCGRLLPAFDVLDGLCHLICPPCRCKSYGGDILASRSCDECRLSPRTFHVSHCLEIIGMSAEMCGAHSGKHMHSTSSNHMIMMMQVCCRARYHFRGDQVPGEHAGLLPSACKHCKYKKGSAMLASEASDRAVRILCKLVATQW